MSRNYTWLAASAWALAASSWAIVSRFPRSCPPSVPGDLLFDLAISTQGGAAVAVLTTLGIVEIRTAVPSASRKIGCA
jgi:hypothetical protein